MAGFDTEYSIVVVGAGGSGMMAALAAVHQGARILLLEKDTSRGCNTQVGGGLIQGAGTRYQKALGIEDSPELMMADIMAANHGQADEAVVRAICERSADAVHFLADVVGVDLHLDANVLYVGHSVHRMHAAPGETGAEVIAAMRQAVAADPRITFVDRAEVTGLIQENGRVVGVETAGLAGRRIGGSVILAADGFGANQEMIGAYCPEIANAVYVGSRNNTGDAIRWGAQVGGALDRMTAYQGHAHVHAATGTRLGGGLPSMGSILVNRQGHRFAREDQGYSGFARIILAQPGGEAIEIFDQRIFDLAWHSGIFRQAFEAGQVVRAGTLRELAELFELPADVLEEEVTDYNRAVREGNDRFGRREFGEPLTAPFYGSLVTGALAHTQGGLRIDPTCRVLREDNTPIEGLYAVGGTAVGMSGNGPEGYLSGNGLAHAFGTGLIAGESLARSVLSPTG